MGELLGRPVLLEFWDFCRPTRCARCHTCRNGTPLRDAGLVVVSVHSPGFRAERQRGRRARRRGTARDRTPGAARHQLRALAGLRERRLARALPRGPDGMLADFHYGEGAYEECELAIGEPLGIAREPMAPLRPEDAPAPSSSRPRRIDPSRRSTAPTRPARSGRCSTAAASLRAERSRARRRHPGAYLLAEHARHTRADLPLELGRGVRCDGVCFTPGLAAG